MDRIDLTRRAADAAHLAADRERAIALARDAAARLDAERDPVRFGLVQERLGRYLWAVGRDDEAALAYREAVATLPADPPSAERARVVAAEGQLLMLRGRAREAIARCEEALAVARAVGARAEEGQALNTLGTCRAGLGEHEAGEACLREALAIALELQQLDDVGRAYVNLSDCVDQAGRIDEAARLALDGFEAGQSLGLGTGYRAMLLGEAAQRTFRAGRWDDAERLADRALRMRAGGLVEGVAHATVAQIAAARGDPAAARGRLRACARDRSRPTRPRCGPRRSTRAPPSSSSRPDEPAAARDVVTRALARSEGQEFPFFTARLHWVGLRAEAELAEAARAESDEPAERDARARAADLAERIAGQVAATPPGTPAPELLLYAALCAAELTRVDARARPGRVGRAITRADALAHPGRRRLRPLAPCRGGARARAAPRGRRTAPRRSGHGDAARRPAAAGGDPARWRGAAASSSATPRKRPPRTASTSRRASARSCASSPPAAPTARSAPSCT